MKLQNIKEEIYDKRLILLLSVIVIFVMIIMVVTYRTIVIRYGILTAILVIAYLFRNKIKEIILKFKNVKK